MNNILRQLAAASVVALGLAATPQANAYIVDSVGDSFSVLFQDAAHSLSATVQFTVTNFAVNTGEDDVDFDITITNNSLLSSDRLVSFGIVDLTPSAFDASTDNGWDVNSSLLPLINFAGTSVELCVWDGSNCNGGANGGVAGAGGVESFHLDLDLFFLTSSGLDLSGFSAKFQTANGSFHPVGCIVGTRDCGTTTVPEPGTLALFSLGLLGLGLASRRRTGRN